MTTSASARLSPPTPALPARSGLFSTPWRRLARAWLPALACSAALFSAPAAAQTKVVVGYQLIVGPFLTAIQDGSFNKAAQAAGYDIEWRQFTSAGDISSALASGRVPIGVIGSTGIAAAVTRGVNIELFWILDNIGKSEALVARDGSGIDSIADLAGKRVAVPFVSTAHFHLLVGMERIWKINPRDVRIMNLQPPQIVAAWQRGDIDAAYVWPPALTEIQKTGKTLSDSEAIGKDSVPTFDGIVADRQWAEKNPKFMAAFTGVLAHAYDQYNATRQAWTADSAQVQAMVKLIGGNAPDMVEALGLLVFPGSKEQASNTWLGGGKDSGAARAFTASADFLKAQKQIDKVLDDYSPYVNGRYAAQAAQ